MRISRALQVIDNLYRQAGRDWQVQIVIVQPDGKREIYTIDDITLSHRVMSITADLSREEVVM